MAEAGLFFSSHDVVLCIGSSALSCSTIALEYAAGQLYCCGIWLPRDCIKVRLLAAAKLVLLA